MTEAAVKYMLHARAGDILHVRSHGFYAWSIRAATGGWGNHNAPVFYAGGVLTTLNVTWPRHARVPLYTYLEGLEAAGARWLVARPAFTNLMDPDELSTMGKAMAAYAAQKDGEWYDWRDINRIVWRALFKSAGLPEIVRPNKGAVYCTEASIEIVQSYRQGWRPRGIPEAFPNPSHVELSLAQRDRELVQVARSHDTVPEFAPMALLA